ncbi:hypothetical protein PsorP6_006287 [Peronosclerospora sorghi]|uniref:Uncharacterized protein n=1 Tax=Peronosclerospora sorghi TaxID=230839 RepID=A0ACC0W6V7_9STRA|nr:hypothetical protein PsorP6_006287 [Peronosclerospora sorghi]
MILKKYLYCDTNQQFMDLLDAIEELEQPATARAGTQSAQQDFDFIEHQVLFIQQQLREFWKLKYHNSRSTCVPYYWVFSKVLQLIEEYPNGLTEAIVVTELTKLLEEKALKNANPKTEPLCKKRKMRDPEAIRDFFVDGGQNILHAKVTFYENYRITLKMETPTELVAHTYLHPRFRSCLDILHQNVRYGKSNGGAAFPFETDREIAFTNAKVFQAPSMLTLLPTAFMMIQLDEDKALDRTLLTDALSLSKADELIHTTQDPAVIQSLLLTVKVLDIGAIQACQSSLYLHRQVIMLGEMNPLSTPRTKQRLHFMVLWDDQATLSRLFRLGDALTIFHPFVHVCDKSDTEIVHLLNDLSLQCPITYYFEYGSATVLFSQPCEISTLTSSIQTFQEREHTLTKVDDIQPGWQNFSLYAHVQSIKVAHGIPLLAAVFSTHYNSMTNASGFTDANRQTRLAMDRSIMSRFYLVVLLHVYTAASNRLLTIEVTGSAALTAVRLFPGQSIFIDGLVAIDVRSQEIRRFRDQQAMSSSLPHADAAFPTEAYCSSSSSSGLVVLCSDWEKIFGKHAFAPSDCTFKIVNTIPGLLNLSVDRSTLVQNVAMHALARVERTVVRAGWLIATQTQCMTIDTSCERGPLSMYVHTFCSRRVEMITESELPTRTCAFCQQGLRGQDMRQTYADMALSLENRHTPSSPLVVLCQADTVERLLGLAAPAYGHLSPADKRKRLSHVVGTSFRFVLSRCEPRPLPCIHFRVDHIHSM